MGTPGKVEIDKENVARFRGAWTQRERTNEQEGGICHWFETGVRSGCEFRRCQERISSSHRLLEPAFFPLSASYFSRSMDVTTLFSAC
jgi:hypothetical protein